MYGGVMEVSVSKLRAELKDWIDAARRGDEVVITDRGIPVARLSAIASADLITRLQSEGLITPPSGERPAAEHATREPRGASKPQTPLSGLARRLRR